METNTHKAAPQRITCPRCAGKCIFNFRRVHCNVPGLCFECDGSGYIYDTKFDNAFLPGSKGNFYGTSVTEIYKGSLVTTKTLWKITERDLIAHGYTSYTQITEEQARKFYAKYGHRVAING